MKTPTIGSSRTPSGPRSPVAKVAIALVSIVLLHLPKASHSFDFEEGFLHVDLDGGDDSGKGTTTNPFKTVDQALEEAAMTKKSTTVKVSNGTVAGGVVLQNGVSLLGSCAPSDDEWECSPEDFSTIILDQEYMEQRIAVRGLNIEKDTKIEGFDIRASDATTNGTSSYGIHCGLCPGLIIQTNSISSGNGVDGFGPRLAQPSDLPEAPSGGNGEDGGNGICGSTPGLNTGGAGGTSACGLGGGVGETGAVNSSHRQRRLGMVRAESNTAAGPTPHRERRQQGGQGQPGKQARKGVSATIDEVNVDNGSFLWMPTNGVDGADGEPGKPGAGGAGGTGTEAGEAGGYVIARAI